MFTTPTASHAKIARFERWFETAIGTEIEIDEIDIGMWSATCFELTGPEIRMCQEWWDGIAE